MMSLLNRLIAALLLAGLMMPLLPREDARAQPDQGIAAIVNDDVISLHNLQSRLSLLLVTSNLADTPENRKRLAPEVLRTLIDETLKRQEMRKQNITVPQPEIDRTLAQVAQQLRLQPADLPEFLARRGVGMPVLIEQIEAELGWIKVVTRIAGDRAAVTPREIDEEMARTRTQSGAEYRLGEIFLPIDDPAEQARVEELAVRLVAEARGGANFASLARTFSQGPSAANGGDLGWVGRDDLDAQIETVVSRLEPGQVSDPIRAQGGYFILAMVGRRAGEGESARKVTMVLQQAFLPLPKTAGAADVAAAVEKVQKLSAGVTNCEDLATRARQAGAQVTGSPGAIDLQQMPADLRQLVSPLGSGGLTQPVRTSEGVLVLMVCDRQDQAAGEEQRAAVERRLRELRLSAVSRRQLRDLRRTALLDVRM